MLYRIHLTRIEHVSITNLFQELTTLFKNLKINSPHLGTRKCKFYPFVLFLFAIVLSVLLRFTDSDYPFGIFKLFLEYLLVSKTLYFSILIKPPSSPQNKSYYRNHINEYFVLDIYKIPSYVVCRVLCQIDYLSKGHDME